MFAGSNGSSAAKENYGRNRLKVQFRRPEIVRARSPKSALRWGTGRGTESCTGDKILETSITYGRKWSE